MTTATDLCQTVGCNHRRDEHNTFQGCFAVMAGDGCLAFTEPPTVADERAAISHVIADHFGSSAAERRAVVDKIMRIVSAMPVVPSVAEHDDTESPTVAEPKLLDDATVRLAFQRGADPSLGYPSQIAARFDRWLADVRAGR